MRPLGVSLLAGLALASAAGVASGADEPAGTSPATSPAPTTPLPTTPDAAGCPVTGPAFDDRSAPLRAGLPPKQTLIVLTREEQREIPRRMPAKIKSHLKDIGAWLTLTPPNADGSVSHKVPWRRDRSATGRLHVTGKRIDGEGSFRAYVNRRYGGRTFAYTVPGELTFSTTGCWRVKGRAGGKRVTYVVFVRRPAPGELAPYLP